jgi:hypothetical protein
MAGIVAHLDAVVALATARAATRLEDVADINSRAPASRRKCRAPSRRSTPIGRKTGFKVMAQNPQMGSPGRKVAEIEVEVVGPGRTMDGPRIDGITVAPEGSSDEVLRLGAVWQVARGYDDVRGLGLRGIGGVRIGGTTRLGFQDRGRDPPDNEEQHHGTYTHAGSRIHVSFLS